MGSSKVCRHEPAVMDGVYIDGLGRLCDKCEAALRGER